MSLYHINSFNDVRFITLVMRLDRLEEIKDTYLQALNFWSEEIIRHNFGNDNDKLEYISGIIMGNLQVFIRQSSCLKIYFLKIN